MGLFLKETNNQFTLGLWEINETIEDLLAKISLNNEEKIIFERFNNDTRKLHWLSYRNLLQELIPSKAYSHVNYDEFGKPYLHANHYHLSVSHSGKFSAAIISGDFPVGVDIEKTHTKIEKVVYKFLSQEEISQIGELYRLEKFYVCWGAKESLYKIYGQKNLLFQENILLHPFNYQKKGMLTGQIKIADFNKNYPIYYEMLNEYMLVYAIGI